MSEAMVLVQGKASAALLRQARFFSNLSLSELNEMASHFRLEEWTKDGFIKSDYLQSRFYILLDGQLELRQNNPDSGREITLELLYAGDSFDVIVLLDGQAHEVLITPMTPLKVLSIPIDVMRSWLWTYPELNKQFLPYLARRMREQEEERVNLALYDMSTRLSRVILKHIDKIRAYSGARENEYRFHLINGLSDEVLARMVGSVRQVVNKHLQHWKAQGILNKKRNQLMINDLEALYEEAKYTQSSL